MFHLDQLQISIANSSMFSETNLFNLSFDTKLDGLSQFEVPLVIPKVWLPEVPFVVAANTCNTTVFWF